jgi:exopolyphosphatase/guanosine-5'-triphosphate,3'-diphosphate pyrophosphatase
MRAPQVEIHPPALREGVIRQRLDTLDETAQIDRSAQDAPEQLGRLTTFEARCTG